MNNKNKYCTRLKSRENCFTPLVVSNTFTFQYIYLIGRSCKVHIVMTRKDASAKSLTSE